MLYAYPLGHCIPANLKNLGKFEKQHAKHSVRCARCNTWYACFPLLLHPYHPQFTSGGGAQVPSWEMPSQICAVSGQKIAIFPPKQAQNLF